MKRNVVMLTASAVFVAALAHVPLAHSQDLNQGQSAQQAPASGQAKPAAQAGQAAAPSTPAISKDEQTALNAMQHEIDPARQAEMAEDFVKKYPNSPLLSDVYFWEAYSYQRQNNFDNAVQYGEKSLQAKGDNLRSLLFVTELLLDNSELKGSDADKTKKLDEAESDANKALAVLTDAKTPAPSAEQVNAIKRVAYSSLGMIHLQRATMALTGMDPDELGKAEEEYKLAVALPNPAPEDYFRLGEAYEFQKKYDEGMDAFTQCSKLSQGQLQTMANDKVAELKKEKAQAPAPAAAPKP
jgi:hypothetical protein